jgi:hypothetical protein
VKKRIGESGTMTYTEVPGARLAIEELFPWLRAVEPLAPAPPASRDEDDDDLAAAA